MLNRPSSPWPTGSSTVGEWLVAAAGLLNVMVALFFLPHSPGFDERTLFAAVYAYEHYHRLFYPVYDMPLMIMHPPTKYWLVGVLVTSGVPLRLATGGLLIAGYLLAVAGAFACRLTSFQRIAVLFALSTTVTLCPFVGYAPENLTHGEIIGRLRPEDLVLVSWFGGLLWLEASRRSNWRPLYSFLGSGCIAFAAVTHYFGIPAVAAIGVYASAAALDSRPGRAARVLPMAIAAAVVILPVVFVVKPYLAQIAVMITSQNGEASALDLSTTWARHMSDLWLLLQWMKMHAGNVWPALVLLTGPVRLNVPPVLFAGVVLVSLRSSRVLGLAALSVPVAVVFAAHKWIGYELPEIALFLLACGWVIATVFDRISDRRLRTAAVAAFLVSVASASPLIWDRSHLRFMDQQLPPALLRAMGRDIVGPGASMYASVYTGGEDKAVMSATADDHNVDYFAEREFNLDSAPLHDALRAGRMNVAGFIFTPTMPSASVLYLSAKKPLPAVAGYVVREGVVQRFSTTGTGARVEILECRATPAELPWVSPKPPVLVSGYMPRIDHCVKSTLARRGLGEQYATMFLRRTFPNGDVAPQAVVPLLIDEAAAKEAIADVRAQCGCQTLQTFQGGLTPASADRLLSDLERNDSVVRFYASAADLAAGRTMAERFAGKDKPRD